MRLVYISVLFRSLVQKSNRSPIFEFIFILIFDQKIDSTITINSKLVKIFTICFKVFYGKIINFIYGELKKAIYTLIFSYTHLDVYKRQYINHVDFIL
ncbi:hypothetical protein B4U84_23195 [Westiellopsis prolifica IICB1]|nr:hypothetical protein B4U84_23195 [Westiellopsis prolifica IICB1]